MRAYIGNISLARKMNNSLVHLLLNLTEKVTRTWTVKRKLLSTAPIERKLEKALAEGFRKQGREFLSRLYAVRGQWPMVEDAVPRAPKWEPAFDEAAEETLEAFERPLNAAVTAALYAGSKASLATAEMNIAFDLKNPRAVAYLKDHGAELVSKVNDVSKEQIRSIIAQGMEGGWSYNQTAKELTAKFEQFAVGSPLQHIDSRAHLIAVTEASHAYEHGNKEGVQSMVDAGLDMEKAWIAEEDERTCETCSDNATAGWVAYDEPFPGGEDTAEDSHPGCRCATEYRRAGSGRET